MSNEISVSTRLRIANGHCQADINPGTLQITSATVRGPSPGVVTVGTAEEVISFAELTALGWLHLQNLDITNYVDFGPENGGAMVAAVRLLAGERAVFRMVPGVAYRAKANGAPCNVVFSGFNA